MLLVIKRMRDLWKWALIIIVFTALGIFLLPYFKVYLAIKPTINTPISELAAETTDRAVLESNAEIQIPPSATEIRGYIDGFRDITTYVRFVIPAADIDKFTEGIDCVLPSSTTDTGQRMPESSQFTWWKPNNAQSYRQCYGTKEHLVQRVFVDTTQPDRYIVYVVASTK